MQFMSFYRPLQIADRSGPQSAEHMAQMGALIQEMMASGHLVETGGLAPSAAGARVALRGGKTTVTDGPFGSATKLISGYAVLAAASLADAVEHAKRFLAIAGDGETEVRPMFGMPGSTEPARYLMMYRPDADCDHAPPPTAAHMAKMGAYAADLTARGILLGTGGLGPSSQGKLARYANSKLTITDGPFAEVKELVSGFAKLEYPTVDAAAASLARFFAIAGDGVCDIRPVWTPS